MSLDVRVGAVPGLVEILAAHPRVRVVGETNAELLAFSSGDRWRRIWGNHPSEDQYGLVELIDNNPLVCADDFSLPTPAGTLALIAFGPLIRAGILAERPTALLSFEEEGAGMDAALSKFGWDEGVTGAYDRQDFGSVLAGTFIASIQTPPDPADIDLLYEEDFGRSFFVGREEASEWSVNLVAGKPYARYRLRCSLDNPTMLLTIQVMADKDGKCGASQVVHAMNVMAGFEESLGVS